jgi:hypothetical protein
MLKHVNNNDYNYFPLLSYIEKRVFYVPPFSVAWQSTISQTGALPTKQLRKSRAPIFETVRAQSIFETVILNNWHKNHVSWIYTFFKMRIK